jgi:hypothetical protein
LGWSNQIDAESSSPAGREFSRSLATLLTPDVTLPRRVTVRGVFHRWALLAGDDQGRSGLIRPARLPTGVETPAGLCPAHGGNVGFYFRV